MSNTRCHSIGHIKYNNIKNKIWLESQGMSLGRKNNFEEVCFKLRTENWQTGWILGIKSEWVPKSWTNDRKCSFVKRYWMERSIFDGHLSCHVGKYVIAVIDFYIVEFTVPHFIWLDILYMSKSIAEINSIQLVGGHPGRHLDKKFTSTFWSERISQIHEWNNFVNKFSHSIISRLDVMTLDTTLAATHS